MIFCWSCVNYAALAANPGVCNPQTDWLEQPGGRPPTPGPLSQHQPSGQLFEYARPGGGGVGPRTPRMASDRASLALRFGLDLASSGQGVSMSASEQKPFMSPAPWWAGPGSLSFCRVGWLPCAFRRCSLVFRPLSGSVLMWGYLAHRNVVAMSPNPVSL